MSVNFEKINVCDFAGYFMREIIMILYLYTHDFNFKIMNTPKLF